MTEALIIAGLALSLIALLVRYIRVTRERDGFSFVIRQMKERVMQLEGHVAKLRKNARNKRYPPAVLGGLGVEKQD